MTTPKNLTEATCSIVMLLIRISHTSVYLSYSLVPNIIKFVFFKLSDNLFTLNQYDNFSNSTFIMEISLPKLSSKNKILVSSAKRIKYNKSEQFTMSFTYIKNNNGPRIEPWGTPQHIG